MFKFLWNAGAALFWLIVIGGVGIWLPLTLWWSGGCASEEFERVQSPDATKAVLVEVVNCGATTNWQTDIVVTDLQDADERELLVSLDGHPKGLSYVIDWSSDERVAVTGFDFNNLLSFKSTRRVGDLVEAEIRPGLVSQ